MPPSKNNEQITYLLESLQKEVTKLGNEIDKIGQEKSTLTSKVDFMDKTVDRLDKTVEKISGQIETLKKELQTEFKEAETDLKENYVSNEKFEPVKLLVYGVAGLILIAVIGALLGMVIIPPAPAAIH